jgi:predicted phage replisome organizer/uncharacterized phage protein (TIGR02220 family)
MFEDEKIRLIESMPEADTILIIWVKLLAQAGKTNASGYIYLAENIPYTDEMLSTIFNRPLPTVRLALATLERFGMIEISEDQMICISNWEKHQNVAGLDKIREQTRKRVAKHREQKKIEVTEPVTENVTLRNATDIEEELEEDKEKEKKDIPYVAIVSYLNVQTKKSYRPATPKTKDCIRARWNEGFRVDDFKKVIDIKTAEWLNDKEMNKFLRPETLFGTKFESYLNQKGVKGNATDPTSKRGPDLPF